MDRNLKIIKYAGFGLIIIGLSAILSCLFTAWQNYKEGNISIQMIELNNTVQVKEINAGKFTSLHVGAYEFKPTFIQSIILSDDGLRVIGATTVFYLLLSIFILLIVYKRPKWISRLTEEILWKFVVISAFFFAGFKFLEFYLISEYVASFTGNKLSVYHFSSGSSTVTIVSMMLLFTIIYELFSYSRQLKQENDLTI